MERVQIAEVLWRPVSEEGHTLRAAAIKRPYDDASDAYIEAVDAYGFTSDTLLVTLVGRDGLGAEEAIELASRNGFTQVRGLTAEGKIQI